MTLSLPTATPASVGNLTKVYHYDIFSSMRRTTFHPGPLQDRLTEIADRWGMRPAAGPGEGHSTLIRLALRTVAAAPPPVASIPAELLRLREAGPRHTVLLEEADDAAIRLICEAYNLKSTAAALRVAVWLVDQHGLGVGAAHTESQSIITDTGGN